MEEKVGEGGGAKSVVRDWKMRAQWEAETKVEKNNEMEGEERKEAGGEKVC